ncbi:sulfotransferase, partial [Bacteroidota bacterium]
MSKGKYRTVKENFQVYLPPAVGYSFSHLIRLVSKNHIAPKYYFRALIILLVSLIGIPFRQFENLKYKKKIREYKIPNDPVFIIGHWRSGTTYLHNILSKDPKFCYVTTYQGVFPGIIFRGFGHWFFKSFMKLLIPSNRKGDNVKLNVDYPQEEEFALGESHNSCFYFFWYFPKKLMQFFDSQLLLRNRKKSDIERFKGDYIKLVKKTHLLNKKEILISKNPPNTARVKILLESFPNAKFIFIYRDPVKVIQSTSNFFDKMMPVLWFHELHKNERDEVIFDLYKRTIDQYFLDKELIPENQLYEVKFEELEKNPLDFIQQMYAELNIPGYDNALPYFKDHINQSKGYKKNVFALDNIEIERISLRVHDYIEKFG